MKPVVRHTLGALLCLSVLGGSYLLRHRHQDRQPPTISIDQPRLSISVRDDPSVLLSGVTAVDDEDGNVTDLVVMEKIGTLNSDFTAEVTYAAFDRSGNVAKATREVHYTDYTGMHFQLTAPLVFSSSRTYDLMDFVRVTDSLDGDISSRIKPSLAGGSTTLKDVGRHEVLLRVTNSLGYTQRLTVPVDIHEPEAFNASVQLTDYLIYLKQGDPFDPGDYPLWLTTGSQLRFPLTGTLKPTTHLDIRSDVNTAVPGTYTVGYTAEDGRYRGYTNLIVVVEE